MAKLVLEIDISKPLTHNDVIRFNKSKNKWEVVSYKTFNNDLYQERNNLQREINALRAHHDNDVVSIREELKLHRQALKILTGRDL